MTTSVKESHQEIISTTVESKTLHEDEDTAQYEKIFDKRKELTVFLEDGEKSFPIQKTSFMKIIEVMPKKKELSVNYVSFSATSTTEIEERTEMLKKQKSKAIEKEAYFKINIPKSHPLKLTFSPDNNEFDLFKSFFDVRENAKKIPPVNEEVNVPEEEKHPKLDQKPKVLKTKKEEPKKEEPKKEEPKKEEPKKEEPKKEEPKKEEPKKEEPKKEEPKKEENKPTKLRGKKKEKKEGGKPEEKKDDKPEDTKKEEPKKEEPKKEEKKEEPKKEEKVQPEPKETEEKPPEESKVKLRGAKKQKQGKKEDKKEDEKEEKKPEKKKEEVEDKKETKEKKVEYQVPVQYTEYTSSNKVQYAHHWRTHPRTYGKDSRYCRVCRNTHGLIRKYGLNICRKCFRERYALLGFKTTK